MDHTMKNKLITRFDFINKIKSKLTWLINSFNVEVLWHKWVLVILVFVGIIDKLTKNINKHRNIQRVTSWAL